MANRRLLLGMLAISGLMAYMLLNSDDTLLKYVWPQETQPVDGDLLTLPTPGAATGQQRTVVLNPLSLSAEALSELVDRPLFNPTRAPRIEQPPPPPPPEVVVVEAPVEAAPEFDPSDYTLLGVAASADVKTAMIRSNKTDEIFHVSAGQKLMDLTIETVSEREVTLRLDQNSYKLKLFENPGQRNAAPPQIQFQQPGVNEDGTQQ